MVLKMEDTKAKLGFEFFLKMFFLLEVWGFRVLGGFGGFQGSAFRILFGGILLTVWGLEYRVWDLGFRVCIRHDPYKIPVSTNPKPETLRLAKMPATVVYQPSRLLPWT